MKNWKYLVLAGVLAACASTGLVARAEYGSSRQYYSSWYKHPNHSYSYRYYYYKPTPTYTGYKHHYVVHFPSKPKYYYYYNPVKKQYWGRCPSQYSGEESYSMLKEEDRQAKVDDIPEAAFPKPGKMPPIPDSDPKEGAKVDLPPDDPPGKISEEAPAN